MPIPVIYLILLNAAEIYNRWILKCLILRPILPDILLKKTFCINENVSPAQQDASDFMHSCHSDFEIRLRVAANTISAFFAPG